MLGRQTCTIVDIVRGPQQSFYPFPIMNSLVTWVTCTLPLVAEEGSDYSESIKIIPFCLPKGFFSETASGSPKVNNSLIFFDGVGPTLSPRM